jgi:ectoine hydroxylase-related dioxygenase (phytanoyl-CoA dioxygenase family)
LLRTAAIDRVRATVRRYAEAAGWVIPEPGNPPRFQAAPGARIGRAWTDPLWIELQRVVLGSPEFAALAAARPLMAALRTIFGEPAVRALSNFCWLRLPGEPAQTTGPHQDSFYLPRSPGLWTAWIPVVEIPMDLGPIALIPGSHREGLRPHRSAFSGLDVGDHEVWATGPFAPGDVVLFGAHTIHCAWSNMTPDLVRAAFDIRYEPRSLVTLDPEYLSGAARRRPRRRRFQTYQDPGDWFPTPPTTGPTGT